MMFYRRRASPKHRNDMTEVEYGGGGHRTRLRNDHEDQLVCLEVPPPLYIKGGRRRGPAKGVARPRKGKPTPSRFAPSFLVLVGEGKERERRRREEGAGPPCPKPIRFGPWGLPTLGAPPLGLTSSSSLLYIRGQGTPQRHNRQSLSRVWCPPPQLHTSIIPLRSLGGALRR